MRRRVGAAGQALLMRDVHVALLRVLEATEDVAVQPPDAAGVEASPDLGPHNAFRCSAPSPPPSTALHRPHIDVVRTN